MNGLQAPDEMQLNTLTQQATQQNSEKSKPTSHHCKKPGHYRNQCRQLKREKKQAQHNMDSADNNNGNGQTNSNSNNKASNKSNANNTNNQRDRRSRPVYPPAVELTTLREKCYLGASPKETTGRTKSSPIEKCSRQLRSECPSCSPNFKLKTPRLHSGAAFDRRDISELPKLPPIPEVLSGIKPRRHL